jgi:hypothetical protein
MTTWTVDCGECGQSYEQGGWGYGPVMCGACGSRAIRVVQHVEVFDRRNVPNERACVECSEERTLSAAGLCHECEQDIRDREAEQAECDR